MAMLQLESELQRCIASAQLSTAVQDVERVITLLSFARNSISIASDPHSTSLALTKLQNPVKDCLDDVTDKLRVVNKGQNKYGKALTGAFAHDKIVKGDLPTEHDPMADQPDLINRAIAMHLLREGEFTVASTFINEAHPRQISEPAVAPQSCASPNSADTVIPDADEDVPVNDQTGLRSEALHTSFSTMYSILSSLKARELQPAINWARRNRVELEARGSNLEFELCKLQFIWLFKGPEVNGLRDTPANGKQGALRYARENFSRFQLRHLREIQKLSCAMIYGANLTRSPYCQIFDTTAAFDEVATSFTREYCSLLGLSAESPLYIAATAGAIALPQLMKFMEKVKEKGTEWTTAQELAFETPLPKSMIYHSIFVCPVSKEQTTDVNPPMMLPCGHVLAKESLSKLTKSNRYKCPYCPSEGQLKDAKQVTL